MVAMRSTRKTLPRSTFSFLVLLSILSACGGGGGGGNRADDPAQFSGAFLLGFPRVVASNGGETVASSTLDFSIPSASMPNAGFGLPDALAPGEVHRIELEFSRGLDLESVFPGFIVVGPTFTEFMTTGGSQLDALRLVRVQGGGLPDLAVRLLIDHLGSIDPTNAIANGETPELLRLYVESATQPGEPGVLPAGQYRLTLNGPGPLNPGGLRTIEGEPFCLMAQLGECFNPVDVVQTFSVGVDAQLLEPAPSPAVPVTNSVGVAPDQEFVIRFTEAVDFRSLVGALNVSTREPFASVVLPINDVSQLSQIPGGTVNPAGANVVLTYDTADPDEQLPPNYGFVVYQPDPFRDPTQVRVRIVDAQVMQGTDDPDGPAPAGSAPFVISTQNYGLDPEVYEGAGLEAPVNNQGGVLGLPPVLPLPASLPGELKTLRIDVLSRLSPLASDTSDIAQFDGVLGVTDRSRNPMATDLTLQYGIREGQALANNPVSVDLAISINGDAMRAISAGRNDTSSVGIGTLIGQAIPIPDKVEDPSILSSPLDVAIGNPVNVINSGLVPRMGETIDPVTVLTGGDPAIPAPQGGLTPDAWIWPVEAYLEAPGYAPIHGDYLYVIDGSSDVVKIFNSNTFQQIGIIPGLASPSGLGVDPNGQFLYVSNRSQGTVSRVDLQPASPAFHTVNGVTAVGLLPTEVSVQPGNEDVLVINSGEDSFSRVTLSTFSERARFNSGPNPTEIWVTARNGATGAYQAFVSNGIANQVTVYESDSLVPQVFNSNGIDGKIWQTITGFQNPTQGIWDRGAGFWVANNDGSSVEHVALTNLNLGPMPGFMGPPPFRIFSTVGVLNVPATLGKPTDVTLPPLNGGSVAYVATTGGQVGIYATATGILLGTVATPSTDLYTLFDQ